MNIPYFYLGPSMQLLSLPGGSNLGRGGFAIVSRKLPF